MQKASNDAAVAAAAVAAAGAAAAAAAGAVVPSPAAGGGETMIAPTLVAAPSLIPSALAGKASQIRKLYKALL